MSIEKDLNQPVEIPQDHKANLRRVLLNNMKGAQKRTHRHIWPIVIAAPVAALAIVAVLAILPMEQSSQAPGIVKKTLSPLTAQSVFAEAIKNVPDQTLQPGQYYYLKMYRESVGFNKESTCDKRTDITEFYINDAAIAVKTVRYTADGKLFQVDTTNETGTERGKEFYADNAAADSIIEPSECPFDPTYSVPDDQRISYEESERIRNLPVNKAATTLSLEISTPAQQKEALELLKESKDWTLSENVSIERYIKPVIQLENTYMLAGKQQSIRFYFDQQTKKYVGLHDNKRVNVVLEQDIRPYKSNPEYERASPGQM